MRLVDVLFVLLLGAFGVATWVAADSHARALEREAR